PARRDPGRAPRRGTRPDRARCRQPPRPQRPRPRSLRAARKERRRGARRDRDDGGGGPAGGADVSPKPAQTRLLRALLDHANEPLLALDLEGTILDANVAAASFLGQRREGL